MQLYTAVFLALYLLSVLSIGFLYRRRAGRDEVSYFIADRSLSTFWGFLGLASLTTGGSTTIVLAAFVYANGISGLWLDLAGALGLAAIGVFLAARVRREGAVTLPEIVGRHYGPGARQAAASFRRKLDRSLALRSHQVIGGSALERQSSRQHLECHDSERESVAGTRPHSAGGRVPGAIP